MPAAWACGPARGQSLAKLTQPQQWGTSDIDDNAYYIGVTSLMTNNWMVMADFLGSFEDNNRRLIPALIIFISIIG